MKTVKVKRLSETAIMPTRGSEYAAGYDLCADVDGAVIIYPHETVMMSTNVAMEIPKGYFGGIYARSGLSTKEGIRPANCVGVIDSDYRGPIGVPMHNDTDEPKTIQQGQRIAQIIIQPVCNVSFCEERELSETSDQTRIRKHRQ